MAILKNKNAEIYYEIRGEGKPLILLAGLASDSQSWSTVMNKLAKEFMLIMPDNRGCDRTICPLDEITISGMADDVIALMDHLNIEKADLLGHSMGGYVAQQLCLDHPDRFDKLILAASSSFTNKRNKALLSDLVKYREDGMEMMEWYRCLYFWIFSRHFFEDEKMLDLSLTYSVEYPYPQSLGQFKKQVEALNGFDVSDRLQKIRQHSLILCGKEDILFNPYESIPALSKIPNSEVSIIENAAHAIHTEQAEAFVKEVVAFLQ